MADKNDSKNKVQNLLALMKTMHWQYWTAHWQTKGTSFFGDHGFFGDVYLSMVEEIDGLAEKSVAKFGIDVVDSVDSVSRAHKMLERFSNEKDLFQKSLTMEETFCSMLIVVRDSLKDAGELTLGWDNFLQGLCDKHEGTVYKLKQRLDLN
jgi:DNA-binding ferritin-like protein